MEKVDLNILPLHVKRLEKVGKVIALRKIQ